MVLCNTNGGRGFLASTPHMVLHNTMWGVDAKIPLPPLAIGIEYFYHLNEIYYCLHD